MSELTELLAALDAARSWRAVAVCGALVCAVMLGASWYFGRAPKPPAMPEYGPEYEPEDML